MNSMDDSGCSRSKKRKVDCQSTTDIISNLPSNILDNILIYLPIQDAVKTSILSKSWRFKWISIPQLVFNNENFFRSRSSKSSVEVSFQIFQILLLHGRYLHKVVLSIPMRLETEGLLIDQIVLFLTKKYINIQEFTLDFPLSRTTTYYRLPSTLFQCAQLTHLNLSACLFRIPPEFDGFNNIVSVELQSVSLNSDDFTTFIPKCPFLQRLKLKNIRHAPHIFEIIAPNLNFLYISGFPRPVVLKNVPVLSALISKCSGRFTCGMHSQKLLLPHDNTERLVAYINTVFSFQIGDAGVIPKRPPKMHSHLKHVQLSGLCLNSLKEVECVLMFIRIAHNLEKLKIKVHHEAIHAEDTLTSQLIECKLSFNHLREVTMKVFSGTAPELEFVKALVTNSPRLEKFMIQPPKEMSAIDRLNILRVVTRFQRASTKAEIIFRDLH